LSAHDEHILSYGKLLTVLGVLFVLTMITILVSTVDLGAANIWVALLIASVKATFVLLFFMHLKYEQSKAFAITFVVTVFCVALLIGFLFWDISYRV
jgi:cytochrome c oxidase subunit IV